MTASGSNSINDEWIAQRIMQMPFTLSTESLRKIFSKSLRQATGAEQK